MDSSNNFTQGKILSPLIRFSMPIFLAMLLQAMYGAVDLAIVGQFCDKAGVSAVSTGSLVMTTVTGIIIGLTMGMTILLAQKIGEKKMQDAGDAVGSSVLLFAVVGAAVTAAMVIIARPLTALMQAPEEAFEQTYRYILVCSSGIIIITAYNAVSAVYRGLGNSKAPLLFVVIACAINILGDLLLVGVFRLGASGAAFATVFAQFISVVFSILLIRKKKLPFSFTRQNLRFHPVEVKAILRFGSPIALQDFLSNISFMVIIAIMNSLGIVQSAGAGVGEKICFFMMLLPLAFSSSLSAFVAQNIGANEHDRARRAMTYGIATAFTVSLFIFIAAFFFGELLTRIFTQDEAVIVAAANYLKAYAIDSPLVAIYFCMVGYFNGNGKTMFTMLQGFICAFFVRIPFAYFMSTVPGVTMFKIGLGTPLATVAGIIICVVYYIRLKRRKSTLETLSTEPCKS